MRATTWPVAWAFGVCAAMGIGMPAAARAQGQDTVTVQLSDPSRPARVRLEVLNGSIRVRGADRRDVTIDVRGGNPKASIRRPDPPPGLRRLNQASSFSVNEENNEIHIESGALGPSFDADITVPRRTSLKLAAISGAGISVEGVEGDLEIQSVNGSVTLTDVAGSVVANTVNGAVKAVLTRVTAQKAMAFTSLNGTVDVTFPSTVKATFLLRSDRGDVLTDFDLDVQPAANRRVDTRRSGGRYRLEVNRAITGQANGGGPEVELRSFNGSVYLRKGQ